MEGKLIKFTVPIKPVPFPRAASRGHRRYNPKNYSEYKQEIGWYALVAMKGAPPFKGEVRLHADFYRPKPKRSKQVSFIGDADNYLKAVMDALIGICYVDDRQVTRFSGAKEFGKAKVIIEVEEL